MSISPLMSRNLLFAVLAGLAGLPAAASPDISAQRILAHTKVLSSDEFEGRAPGTPGEEKTIAYLVSEFRRLGLEPGNPDGSYLQSVPLVGISSHPRLSFALPGGSWAPTPNVDFVGPTTRIATQVEVAHSEVVFVGYGIIAPEFGWDDFKDVDVRGKTIVVLVNDPPVTDPRTGELDPQVFGGKAMTYYGRWTYKYEIAAAKGAAACLIVHETVPAAYPFSVVVDSRGRENFELRAPDLNATRVGMEGWLTHDAACRLFAATGHDYEALKRAANSREFRPVPLGITADFAIASTLRNVDSHNVIARLPGADPAHRAETVIYTAHWDHLGRDPSLPGDQIYNGALDNASGVAVLLELAHAFVHLPPAARPRRSVVFLSVTGEEQGLLGSRYYAAHPLHPLAQTLADINMDGANPFGPTSDLAAVGFGASTIDEIGAAVAQSQDRTMEPEAHPEHGSYYRSDHLEFAKVGVPGYYPGFGQKFIGRAAGFGEQLIQDYISSNYHKVTDEVRPDWTFEGAAQDTAFLFEVGRRIADGDRWPEWKPGSPFKARRDAMLGAHP
jgi:Zn-dependent M28 family amino/carboxypeptidase